MSTSYIVNNSSNSGPILTFIPHIPETEAGPVHAMAIEPHEGTETDKIEADESVLYAEQTKIDIRKAAARGIHLVSGSDNVNMISVRKARLGLDPKTEAILLNSEMVARFPVDQVIRNRLGQLGSLRQLAVKLGFGVGYLTELSIGRTRTIKKDRADELNQHFKENNPKNGSKIFDVERIFKLAMNESLSQKTEKKLCESVWIKYDDKQHQQLKELPNKVRRAACFRQRMREIIKMAPKSHAPKSITIKDASIINKIADKVIFNIDMEAVAHLPSPEEEELNFLQNDKEPKLTNITPESLLLARAIQEAKEEAEQVVNGSRKRSSSDTSSTSEDLDEPSSKKQRKANDDIDTSSTRLPSFAEFEANLRSERLTEPRVLSAQQTSTRLPSFAEFEANLRSKRLPEPRVLSAQQTSTRLPSFAEFEANLRSKRLPEPRGVPSRMV